MSRHRNIRNLDIDSVTKHSERDDYLDYGQSVEEDVPFSPTTAQFIYDRHGTASGAEVDKRNLSDFMPSEPPVPEERATDNGHFDDGFYGNDYYDDNGTDVFDFDDVGVVAKKKPAAGAKKGATQSSANVPKPQQNQSKNQKQSRGRQQNQQDKTPATFSGAKKPFVVRLDDGSNEIAGVSSSTANPLPLPEVVNLRLEATDFARGGSSRSPSPGGSTRTPTPTGYKRSGAATPISRPKMRSRPADSKPLLNLVVVGHVDAGKSTLLGHLLCQMGGVSQRMMHRYQRDASNAGKGSFAYAWVLDETSEERERGVTMDIAQRTFDTATKRITLLDAPGHKDFIPNMLTGASGADAAILVINATRGEFETGFELGGQTREHAKLVRSMGVNQLLVAVNKMDTVAFGRDRFDELVAKLSSFLIKQTGFSKNIRFIPVSGLSGVNLANRPDKDHPLSSWYDGPCLLEAVDSLSPPEQNLDEKPLRMVVSDVHRSQGGGVTLMGRIETGSLEVGDRVVVLPSNTIGNVKGIAPSSSSVNAQTDANVPSDANQQDSQWLSSASSNICYSGEHCLVTIAGLSAEAVSLAPGDVVCHPDHEPLVAARKFTLKVVIFEPPTPLTKGYSMELHAHHLCEPVILKKLKSELNKATGEVVRLKPRCLVKHSTGVIDVECTKPICLEMYANCRVLGRVTLRAHGRSVAAGMVEKVCYKEKV